MKPRILHLLIPFAMVTGLAACGIGDQASPASFDLENLLIDVFNPQPGETVLILMDIPFSQIKDNEQWLVRREMAQEWHAAFVRLGEKISFEVLPILTYRATGAHNAPIPDYMEVDGEVIVLKEIAARVNIIVALTEFSATASLMELAQAIPDLRAASMPMVTKGMEQTALAADYSEMAGRCQALFTRLDQAVGAQVEFSTGHQVFFDLGYRHAEVDDGQLGAHREGIRVINLPSGEAYIAPYEGEIEGVPSQTQGMLPIMYRGALIVGRVEGNRIIEVIGDGPEAASMWAELERDPARQNVAELGLGCNDKAVFTGNVLEDEKVLGMHWAYGRSDHIGGTVGAEDFQHPAYVTHRDFVYPQGGPIEVTSLVLQYEDGSHEEIIRNGDNLIFKSGLSLLADTIFPVWLLLAAGSWSFLAWDMARRPAAPRGGKLLWALVTPVSGPFGLLAYLVSNRVREKGV